MASVVTLIIEKTMKKIISDLPTLIFSRYETGTTGIFFTPYFVSVSYFVSDKTFLGFHLVANTTLMTVTTHLRQFTTIWKPDFRGRKSETNYVHSGRI
jgi:hypothetical protein